MQTPDYVVLVGYFLVMIGIGIWTSRRIKKQDDYFMGGRGFGKLLQTFAAFGAGTGSSDPVNTGSTTFTNGMSGMWSVMYWLFVTPFYWITGVWYRRMRHLTLGDWFVERYESRAMGLGYCIFGLLFFMVYGSMLFSAIGKVAAPLVEREAIEWGGQVIPIEYILVPIIGVVVLVYGIAGGLEAAYYTDLIQGMAIILLSIILIPFGLSELVKQFGDPSTQSLLHGFTIMHEQLPKEHFYVVGSTSGSEFPWYRILAVVVINLVGIVVQPHFIATGGGSAKNELTARVGLVTGNFLKRFCTVGWVLTALIALALYSNSAELIADPDKTWGFASRNLLSKAGIGLTGLMLACLLAALMSSVDAYMVVGSALVVRNIYAPYINPNASEKQYVNVGRLTGAIVVVGAITISLIMGMDVFNLLMLTWIVGVLFAAPFWVGMYWRRATKTAAWVTVGFSALMFFIIPFVAPMIVPSMRTNENFLITNQITKTTTVRDVALSDIARRDAEIAAWDDAKNKAHAIQDVPQRQTAIAALGSRPQPLTNRDKIKNVKTIGGRSVFWTKGVQPVDESVQPKPIGQPKEIDANTSQVVLAYAPGTKLRGNGSFQLDFLLYRFIGIDLTTKTDAMLATLELPAKIISPFVVMILISLITPRNSKESLDRYYAKMNTPVDADPQVDQKNLQESYANPQQFEKNKLLPGSSFEFYKPSATDLIGFVVCFLICFGVIGLAVLAANIQF